MDDTHDLRALATAGSIAWTIHKFKPSYRLGLRVALSFTLWPILLSACLYLMWRGIAAGHAALYFNSTYLGFAILLFALERVLPYERKWARNDGQMLPDLAHTLLSKGLSQMLVVVGVAVGLPRPPRRMAGICGRAIGHCHFKSCSDY